MQSGHTSEIRWRGYALKRPAVAAAILTSALVLGACNDSGADDASLAQAGDAGQWEPYFEDLAQGQSRLLFSGTITGSGEYTTRVDDRYAGVSDDTFRPANGGTNADGPYLFSVYADAAHADDADNVVRAWLTVTLPQGAGPGTYQTVAGSDPGDGEVRIQVAGDGYAWQFSRNPEGSVHIAEVGDVLTAAWDFVSADASGHQAEVSGAVATLEFAPQIEARYTISANGEETAVVRRAGAQADSAGRHTLVLGNGVYIVLPPSPQEGTHPITRSRSSDGAVTAMFSDHSTDSVVGEITITVEDGTLSADYTISGSGEDEVTVTGTLEHFRL